METKKCLKFYVMVFALFVMLAPQVGLALTAEYKCTSQCTLCINYPKKTVCSEKYKDDSDDYEKAKKLSKFVNDGLIIPDEKLRPNFDLGVFAQRYFNCELMIKKADQIRDATQNMCVTKTVKYKKLVSRVPASVPAAKEARKVKVDLEEAVENDLRD